MPVSAEEIEHIYTQVVLGTTKDACPFPLTDEGSAFWDKVEAEVAQLRERGAEFDSVPTEVPDLPPWVQQAPEASTSPPGPTGGELARTWVQERESPPAGTGDVPSDTSTGRPPPPDNDGE